MKIARPSGRAWKFSSFLLAPFYVLGASVPNFPPNPVGEKLYREHLFHGALFPITLIACTLLTAGIIRLRARKTQNSHSAE